MPGGNGTGPMGMGPMTGRAAGICAGTGATGYANPVAGRCGGGFGRGRGGMGGGFRNQFFATGLPGWMRDSRSAAPDRAGGFDEKQTLANQAQALQAQLAGVQERLKRLETQAGAEG